VSGAAEGVAAAGLTEREVLGAFACAAAIEGTVAERDGGVKEGAADCDWRDIHATQATKAIVMRTAAQRPRDFIRTYIKPRLDELKRLRFGNTVLILLLLTPNQFASVAAN
jgi:hypothetical protein